ncbi:MULTISPECIES: DegT/DnrJ/EryC1/StrS family aminotransferase [unclassified Bradyrhizobium]|uniref:DegT/DnrJ/EryC1/StrS family aminotransferase n=1 Tax=unclassified Bradyrhizobium TaxID=2631580 RepID=UPI0028F04AA5|nr:MULTISPECIES: DegT/DnrJ/EryC1/StrS family aminotransferase [unclassified Bradyrhizobium]
MTKPDPVLVTRPFLPPLDEFVPYLKSIWESKVLTNSGPFHQQLEKALCEYLGVTQISLFTNGTIALVVALQAAGIKGSVITSPYSFVATSHSLVWNSIRPIFVDVDPVSLNLDPSRIEAAIVEDTTAILPVHCYGHPCDVRAIQAVADKHHLKVIYDAAHAFGVTDRAGSILRHGDLSVLSFHATKVFNTFEGGAIISPDERMKQHIDHLKNFGITDEVTVVTSGLNGKMSEINAAFGLLQLRYIDAALARRREIDARYRDLLREIRGIRCLAPPREVTGNGGYFPILVNSDYPLSRDQLFQKLADHDIRARRYFFPLISNFPMYRDDYSAQPANLPNANDAASRVLCLPIYPGLSDERVEAIATVIRSVSE